MDVEGYVYVDVRSVPEFAAGHPSGAVNVPLMNVGASGMEPNSSFVAVMSAAFAKDAKLVLGCRSGQRSARAAEVLRGAGFTAIADQRAGFDGVRNAFGAQTEAGWAASRLPVDVENEASSYAAIRARVGI
jgi:rhodanese-related sulfurtransferase